MAVNDLQELQRRMNTQSLRDDAQMVQGIPARGQDPVIQQDLNKGMRGSEFEVIEDPNKGMRGVETLPIPPAPPSSLNAIFKKRVIDKDGTETDLLTEITEAFVDKMPVAEEEKKAPVNLQSLGRDALGFNPDTATPEDGGLIGGRRHSQGGTIIEAEQGEFVMSRNAVNAVGVEAMNRINAGGGAGNVNISFAGNVMSQDFIEDEAIPMIKEAVRRGADIGVS